MTSNTMKQDYEAIKLLSSLTSNPFQYRLRQDDEEKMRKTFEKTGVSPLFSYKHANNLDADKYISELNVVKVKIENMHLDAIIKKWYLKKIDQLFLRAKIVEAVQMKDDETVCRLSKKIYGTPKFSANELKTEFETRLTAAKTAFIHSKPVDAKLFSKMIQKTLDYYKISEWDIEITSVDSIRIKHGIHEKRPRILVPSNLKISKTRASRLLTHEIEVHVLRTHNGLQSNIHLLARGLDAYTQTDEGLAMYYQSLLIPSKNGFKPGFWDAWSTTLALETNFLTTYNTLKNAREKLGIATDQIDVNKKAKKSAWRLCLRAYRGIHNTNKKGLAFTRGHVYRTGINQIQKLVDENGTEILARLFVGNINYEHLDDLKKIKAPIGKTPDLIGKKIVKSFFK